METMVVMAGDAGRLSEVVGSRRNLHYSGSTAGTSLQECMKSDLKSAPLLATAEKHQMLATARVKDDSRSVSSAKGPMIFKHFCCHCQLIFPMCHLSLTEGHVTCQ